MSVRLRQCRKLLELYRHAEIAYGHAMRRPGERIAWDTLGGCSYGSFREFYCAAVQPHATQMDHRAWKACEARRPRRADGTYFTDMVRVAVAEARRHVASKTLGARRA